MRTAKSDSDYRFINVASYGRFLTHRIAWALFHGEEPPLYIDHINGNKADNRIANLRSATKAQYQRNTGPRRDSTSGVKGVSWFPPLGKWCARVWVDGRAIWLGTYDRFEHAVAARKRGEETYYGEFAPGAEMN